MNFQYFLLFFSLMFPLVFSPGPANIVFAMAGVRQGVKKSIPLIAGVNVVLILYSLLIGLGLGEVLKHYSQLTSALQLLGALYIVYLAYKFIKPPQQHVDIKKTYTFWDGVILEILNPKAISMLFLMFSVLFDGGFNRTEQVFYLVTMLVVLHIPTHFIWTLAGSSLAKWIANTTVEKSLNYMFASVLLLVAVWIVFYVY